MNRDKSFRSCFRERLDWSYWSYWSYWDYWSYWNYWNCSGCIDYSDYSNNSDYSDYSDCCGWLDCFDGCDNRDVRRSLLRGCRRFPENGVVARQAFYQGDILSGLSEWWQDCRILQPEGYCITQRIHGRITPCEHMRVASKFLDGLSTITVDCWTVNSQRNLPEVRIGRLALHL